MGSVNYCAFAEHAEVSKDFCIIKCRCSLSTPREILTASSVRDKTEMECRACRLSVVISLDFVAQ